MQFSHDAAHFTVTTAFHFGVQTFKKTVKPVFSDHIKQDIFLAFQAGGCLLLHESSAESSCMSFLHYSNSAISNHLSKAISMSPKWMVTSDRFECMAEEEIKCEFDDSR